MDQSFLVQELNSVRKLFDENTIGIVIGDRLNLDTAGAALALFLSLREAGKKVQIISKKEPYVEISNLVGIDRVKKSFSGESNRVVVSLPYNRGEIGKVSYKEEQDRINFYLTAVEGKSISPYETQDINLIWEGASPNVIVVFGMQDAMQVSEFVDSKTTVKVVNIDTGGESFGDVVLVNPNLSSSSEIVTKVMKELRLPINIDIAQNLLDGILYATRNFSKQNTSPLAFESAGVLMQVGAVRSDNRNQGRGNSFPQPNTSRLSVLLVIKRIKRLFKN